MSNAIYALVCPDNGAIRYIGKTNGSLEKRLGCHISAARHGGITYNHIWIRKLDRHGKRPKVILLHQVTAFAWQTMERFFIAAAETFGAELTNGTTGGDGVILPPEDVERVKQARKSGYTDEVKARMSDHIKAAWQRPEVRAKHLASDKKKSSDEEFRKHLLAISKLPRSEEAKANRLAGIKAYYSDPANRQKASERMKARKVSDETRARMSAAQKGKAKLPVSDETKAKMSVAKIGRPLSDAHKAAVKAGIAKRKARLAAEAIY